MYEKDGEKYFVFDSHLHFWDASPENWVKGNEEYAKGWIECFHAYQGLGPAETHWPLDKFQKYSLDDFEKDVFTDGDHNGALRERFPDKKLFINGRFDPREGTAGLEQLEADAAKWNMKGVK